MMKLLLSLLLFLVTVSSGWAQEITGEGVGPTKDQAKKEALADLSQNISVDVKSVDLDNFIPTKTEIKLKLQINGVAEA